MFQKLGKNQGLLMIRYWFRNGGFSLVKRPLPVRDSKPEVENGIIPGIGFFSDGITITAFERTIAGAINETNDKSGFSSGHAMATTPTGSRMHTVAP